MSSSCFIQAASLILHSFSSSGNKFTESPHLESIYTPTCEETSVVDPHCMVSLRILIHHFLSMRIRMRIRIRSVLVIKNWRWDVQATGQVFIPQNRKFRTSKLEFSSLLRVISALLDPDPDPVECEWMRIRIRIHKCGILGIQYATEQPICRCIVCGCQTDPSLPDIGFENWCTRCNEKSLWYLQ